MNRLGNWIGEACKIILPIHEETFHGNPDSAIAICTLSSLDLLRKIANSSLLNQISIAGRLLSENNGIDQIIRHVITSYSIHYTKLYDCVPKLLYHILL